MSWSGHSLLLLIDALPVLVVIILCFSDKVVEVRRWSALGPEVLNSIWEAVVKQILKDVIGPTNFVSRFLELNGVVVNMAVVFHPEVQEFSRGSFGAVRIAEDGVELAGECSPIVDPRVSGLYFNVPAEMMLCHTIEVLNGVIDFLWICWECARLGCEHQATLKKEIRELGVVHT